MAASSIGLLIGASIGSAYLGAALVQDSSARQTAVRILSLASASKDGKFDEAELARLEAATDTQPFSRTAMNIALRFTDYAGTSGSALVTQNLNAIRTSSDQRYQGAQVIPASLTTSTEPMQAATVTKAASFAFKNHSTNDLDCLTQGVYYEARGEGVDGMRAVAQVILNRVRHPAYPKTICNVIYQGAHLRTSCQFSFTCDGSLGRTVEKWAWRRARDVAQAALNGYVMPAVGTATSFHTTAVNPRWSGTMTRVTQVGTHVFYQFRGKSRLGGDGVVQPSDAVPQIIQASADVTSPSDDLNAAQLDQAPAVNMTPTTVAPVGDAKTQLIAAVAQASPETLRATPVKSVVTGKSAQDITAEVSLHATGMAQ